MRKLPVIWRRRRHGKRNCCAVSENLGHAWRKLCGVKTHGDDGVRSKATCVLHHAVECVLPCCLAEGLEFCDVAAEDAFNAADEAGNEGVCADDYAADNSEFRGNLVSREG